MWTSSNPYEVRAIKSEEVDLDEPTYTRTEDHRKTQTNRPRPHIRRTNMCLKRNQPPYSKPLPQNRQELLQSIVRDREVLGVYLRKLNGQQEDITSAPAPAPPAPPAPALSAPPVPQRCSYDLFFESACLTVKNLPPKLAAEAKSRISQILTEFEIRAIEMEAPQQRQTRDKSRVPSDTVVDDESSAEEIVYEFHTCP